ncbi:MAG: hypothetical protein AAB263_06360, partial [Planctomycetota bacterium]
MPYASLLILLCAGVVSAGDPLYLQDFDKAKAMPEDLMLNGEFSLKEDGTGKVLALVTQPLETYNVTFGPSRKEPTSVSARIRGDSKGRLYPAFGIGLNGVSGVIMRISPSKDAVELLLGETILMTKPFTWKTGTWTRLRLSLEKTGDKWTVSGRAWRSDTDEPKE